MTRLSKDLVRIAISQETLISEGPGYVLETLGGKEGATGSRQLSADGAPEVIWEFLRRKDAPAPPLHCSAGSRRSGTGPSVASLPRASSACGSGV